MHIICEQGVNKKICAGEKQESPVIGGMFLYVDSPG
jgi:hypothetical protein